jgi:hypothetical protein
VGHCIIQGGAIPKLGIWDLGMVRDLLGLRVSNLEASYGGDSVPAHRFAFFLDCFSTNSSPIHEV